MAKAGVAYIDVEGNFNPFQQGMNGLLNDLSNRFASFGGAGTRALAGISLSAVAVGYGLVKVGETFDAAFDTIRVGTGATGAELRGLQDDFKEVAKNVPQAFQPIADAVTQVNQRLGLTGQPLQDVATRILELTRLTGGDLNTNIAGITRTFGDWGIQTDQQAGALDKLYRASQNSGVGIDTLTDKVVFFGAPLRQLGFSFEESIAMVSRFEKEGVNLETVLGGMRMALARLAKAGEEPAETFKRVVAEIKELGASGNIIASNTKAIELFGARAGPDVAAAIREGRLELTDYLDVINNGRDTILGAAEDTKDFAQTWQQFKNRVLVAIEPIATRFFDSLSEGLESAAPMVEALTAAFEPLAPILAPIALAFVAIAAAALPLAGLVKVIIKIGSAIKTIGSAIAFVSKLMLANPWILALAAAVLVAVLIIKNWDKIKAFFTKLWRAIEKITVQVWEKIKEYFNRFWPIILGIFTGGIGLVVGLIIKNWDAIKDWTTKAFNDVVDFIKSIPGRILAALSSLLGMMFGFFTNVWETVRNTTVSIVESILAFIASIPGRILGALSSVAGIVWNAIVGAFNAIVGAVGGAIDTVIGIVASMPGRIVSGLGSLFSIGVNWMKGLWDGLIALAGSILSWLGDFASDAIHTITHPWELLSPSKATKRIGGYFMEGLLVGMQDGGEDVVGFLGGFAGDALEAVTPAAGELGGAGAIKVRAQAFAGVEPNAQQVAGGRVVNLNINGPVSIRSEEDLVSLRRGLAREVERQDRAQGKNGA